METVALHGPTARRRAPVRGTGRAAGDVLSAPRSQGAAAAADAARALSVAERRAVLDVLHEPRFVDLAPAEVYARAARRGPLPLLGAHDVPRPRRERRGPRAARSAAAPGVQEARAAGHGAEPGVELGHHEAARPGEVDVLLPVRRSSTSSAATSSAGWSPTARARRSRRSSSRRPASGRASRPASSRIHADRGPSMTLEDGRACSRRPRRHARPTRGRTSRTTTRSPRRNSRRSSTGPTFPSASAPSSTPRPLRRLLRLVQPRAPPRRHRPADAARRPLRPRRSARRRTSSRSRRRARRASRALSAGVPTPPPLPTAVWINPPTLASIDAEEAH